MLSWRLTKKRATVTIAAGLLALVGVAYVCWPAPNASARADVAVILRKPTSPKQQIEDLLPFVKIGDHISGVRNRLYSDPSDQPRIERATELTIPVASDTQLVLAIRRGGKVVGIGRHLKDVDDGTCWFVEPEWQ
jgi:hypothetical protein